MSCAKINTSQQRPIITCWKAKLAHMAETPSTSSIAADDPSSFVGAIDDAQTYVSCMEQHLMGLLVAFAGCRDSMAIVKEKLLTYRENNLCCLRQNQELRESNGLLIHEMEALRTSNQALRNEVGKLSERNCELQGRVLDLQAQLERRQLATSTLRAIAPQWEQRKTRGQIMPRAEAVGKRRANLDDLAAAAMLEDSLPSDKSPYQSGSTEDSDYSGDVHDNTIAVGREAENPIHRPRLGCLRRKMRSMNLRLQIPENPI
ncbi:hypothetical protein VTN77DRAFT_9688 [Rasamsonia byssochlamydoides]|uniref:uncharacterized protein n=1 Tax=Rasamsonia byssochlamydoides TaxID=89139 RepID=UPI0037421530